VTRHYGLAALVMSVLILGGVASLAVACGGGSGTTAPTTPAGSATTAAGAVATGQELYQSLGCVNCHSLDGSTLTGPTWKGLAGSTVHLTGGQTVVADKQYLLNSIETPDKQIVAGFQSGVMSSVIAPGSVSQSDAEALVAFIQSLK
jgi:cytochrome c oxidase subunit 2